MNKNSGKGAAAGGQNQGGQGQGGQGGQGGQDKNQGQGKGNTPNPNYPSTSGNPSGGNRGNVPNKGK